MGKGDKKVNIPLCAALILLTLTLITTHMTCGLYARYTSSATASDSARVAKFDVDHTVREKTETQLEGDFELKVINNSEVAVKYGFVVEFTDPMSVSIGDEATQVLNEDTPEPLRFFNDSWVLAPGEESDVIPMQLNVIRWVGLVGGGGESITKTQYFTLWLYAEQID